MKTCANCHAEKKPAQFWTGDNWCKSCRHKATRGIEEKVKDGEVWRKCSKCDAWKPLRLFHPQKRNADGYAGYCKVCYNEQKYASRRSLAITEVRKGPPPDSVVAWWPRDERYPTLLKGAYRMSEDELAECIARKNARGW